MSTTAPALDLQGHRGARGLVPVHRALPWIPSDAQWRAVLDAARTEPVRNRLMLALAYDCALRREELCALETSDLDPGIPRKGISGSDHVSLAAELQWQNVP